ncbi:hypothetical protein K431DRAFT_285389 [Polychaeton citri CBS 116435]|uniref:ML-like domain-containing protein n=1 Tax=Polychaeton citri CBS 116435 TaxID=1314669 RepID=A0A9P4Q7D9_9PEZI|nr:hypothetical protein K431DRAFT_285389 [Polychaeton citri CBS 116435]
MSASPRASLSPSLRGHSPKPFRLLLSLCVFVLSVGPPSAQAAFVDFSNCLSQAYVHSNPLRLQWVPAYVDAVFDSSEPSHNLNLTIYGNVTGRQTTDPLPPPSDPYWSDPQMKNGKIVNVGSDNKFTTLFQDYQLLSYLVWNNGSNGQPLCDTFINRECPVGPEFNASADTPSQFPAFSVSHAFDSSYAFGTLATTIRARSGDLDPVDIACISANITPGLGPTISGVLCWLPAAILILKGIATLLASIFSPWGSSDTFRWSSNYGRDEDLLRLVTPGFGDCLQYIQFIVLTGALTLQYPGFYQPAVSQAAWSTLLFNESFVSGGNGIPNPRDGVYAVNGTYGITNLSQLVGMSEVKDIWACMAVWFLVIAVVVVLLCQLGFFGRWIYRSVTNTTEEDLQSKNLPFTTGNMLRLLFNYFILPVVSISLFQLVIAAQSPISVVVCAVILLVITIFVGGWIFKVIFSTKPRTILFDDMPTVLLYGPLYNTYSDSAAPFALVPVLITFIRSVAIGAVQPSGIAQIIVLAICEVILILTLNAFRPFQGQTSMNAYHTFFAVVRLITILLSIAFAPTLGVSEAKKGWIGYVILLLHGCVLVFGFFLNSIQTLIEVIARNFGVGADAQLGATRGSILNWRMLKKRENRPPGPPRGDRASMTSNAAILQNDDQRSQGYVGTRSRSISASSQQLLNRMSGFETFSQEGGYGGGGVASPSADENQGQFPAFAAGAGKPPLTVKAEATDTYYRPPRQRTRTIDALTPGGRTRVSGVNEADLPYSDLPPGIPDRTEPYETTGGLHADRDSPAPAYFRDRSDSSENTPPRTDYAVREVDQYYRGPALSDMPRRSLKTGPADPEGPAANAQSWFQKLAFGLGVGGAAKQKEQGKGFEVVRRPPPRIGAEDLERARGVEEVEMVTSPNYGKQEPYKDSPPTRRATQIRDEQANVGAERSVSSVPSVSTEQTTSKLPPEGFHFGLDGLHDPYGVVNPNVRLGNEIHNDAALQHRPSDHTAASSNYNRDSLESQDDHHAHENAPPSLNPIPSVGGFEMPSGFNSQLSQVEFPSTNESHGLNIDLANTAGGQEWLRQVDRLSWAHPDPRGRAETDTFGPELGNTELTPFGGAETSDFASRQQRVPQYSSAPRTTGPIGFAGSHQGRNYYPTPSIPRRSSRRTPSTDNAVFVPGPIPQRTESKTPEHDWSGFDSTNTRFQEEDESFPAYGQGNGAQEPTKHANEDDEPRPTSYHVSHHKAGDSISRNSLGAEAGLRGESATFEWRRSMGGGDAGQQ